MNLKSLIAVGLALVLTVSVCSAGCGGCDKISKAVWLLALGVVIASIFVGMRVILNPSNKDETGMEHKGFRQYSKSDWFWIVFCVILIIFFGVVLTIPVEAGFVTSLPPPNATTVSNVTEVTTPEPEPEEEPSVKEPKGGITENITEPTIVGGKKLNVTVRRVTEKEVETCIGLYNPANWDYFLTGNVTDWNMYEHCVKGTVENMEFPPIQLVVNATYQGDVDIRSGREIETAEEREREHEDRVRGDLTNIGAVIFVGMLVAFYILFSWGKRKHKSRIGGPPERGVRKQS